jgi:hypothetical protein
MSEQKAREDFWYFLQHTEADFDTGNLITKKLAKLLQNILTVEEHGGHPCQNWIISCPQRTGKSSTVIKALAWASGASISDEGLNHFISSYDLQLSGRHKSLWNRTIDSDLYRSVFSDKNVLEPLFTSPRSTSSGLPAGSNHLQDKYRGVLLFDDIIKGLTRVKPLPKSIKEWYKGEASTRVQKQFLKLCIGTRYGKNDFHSFLLNTEGLWHPITNPDGWSIINFPALENDQSCWPLSKPHSYERLCAMRDNPAYQETFWVLMQGEPEKLDEIDTSYCLNKIDPDLDIKHPNLAIVNAGEEVGEATNILLINYDRNTNKLYVLLEHAIYGKKTYSTLQAAINEIVPIDCSVIVSKNQLGNGLSGRKVKPVISYGMEMAEFVSSLVDRVEISENVELLLDELQFGGGFATCLLIALQNLENVGNPVIELPTFYEPNWLSSNNSNLVNLI